MGNVVFLGLSFTFFYHLYYFDFLCSTNMKLAMFKCGDARRSGLEIPLSVVWGWLDYTRHLVYRKSVKQVINLFQTSKSRKKGR